MCFRPNPCFRQLCCTGASGLCRSRVSSGAFALLSGSLVSSEYSPFALKLAHTCQVVQFAFTCKHMHCQVQLHSLLASQYLCVFVRGGSSGPNLQPTAHTSNYQQSDCS